METNAAISAIGWVHTQLVGGLKQIAITSSAYVAILIAAAFLMARINSSMPLAGVLGMEARILLGLQAFVLLGFGVYRITNAVRIDMATNMIESHRLMPLRPSAAVLGYLLGATFQALVLFAINLVISLLFAAMAGLDLPALLVGHGIIFLLGMFAWTFTAMCALVARQYLGLLAGLPMILVFTQGVLLALLPGLAVLVSPLLGDTVFALSTTRLITGAHVAAFVAQVIAGAIFFAGAARRYRRPDRPALLPWQGLVLLAAWVFLSWVGIAWWDSLSIIYRRVELSELSAGARIVASLLMCMLLAIVPLASASWHYADAVAHPDIRRSLPPASKILATLAGVVLIPLPLTRLAWELLPVRDPAFPASLWRFSPDDFARLTVTALSLAAFAVAVHFLLRIVHRARGQRGGLLVFIWLFITWALPLLLDLGRHMLLTPYESHPLRTLSTISPVGTLVAVWIDAWPLPRSPEVGAVPIGLGVQVLLTLLLVALYYRAEIRLKPGPAPAANA